MARENSNGRPTGLTFNQRAQIFDRTAARVTKEYFDPNFNGTKWPDLARESRQQILALEDADAFEHAMHDLVRRLGTSHTGFFHESVKRVPARLAIGATFHRTETAAGTLWIAQDVHEGGPAHAAGLKPGDVVRTIDGVAPPSNEPPMFAMGRDVDLALDRGSEHLALRISIPTPRSKKQPTATLKAVTWSIVEGNVGYLKVPILPGALGLDVAREIDVAMRELASCDKFVLDLRGHVGGGLGVLRLMSHLTPDRIPIGYTVTRKRAERGYDKASLPVLDRLPTDLPNPLAIARMAFKYAGRDTSVALVSEGLGPKRWHGRAAILVNEHTISAGEMVAAFASENRLAAIVGVETAGRLIPGSSSKVGAGYMLVMPKAEYRTWGGLRFEGRGVQPSVRFVWPAGPDLTDLSGQLSGALSALRGR
ncbi:S41 family peptidase [Paludibaculum fermentans]|uniref:S41 family peptidase n=1 Tax=Paludibaculum fermentans TaxID=1473598 RepID=UPI003EC13262